MPTSHPKEPQSPDLQDLVDALYSLRDSFVNASLVLNDVKFELDVQQQSAAAEHAIELLEKVLAQAARLPKGNTP